MAPTRFGPLVFLVGFLTTTTAFAADPDPAAVTTDPATDVQTLAPAPPPSAPALASVCSDTLLFTESTLPADLYVVIRDLEVRQEGPLYDRAARHHGELAALARTLDADALIGVRHRRRVTWVSWSAVRVGGTAVKWSEKAATTVLELDHRCL